VEGDLGRVAHRGEQRVRDAAARLRDLGVDLPGIALQLLREPGACDQPLGERARVAGLRERGRRGRQQQHERREQAPSDLHRNPLRGQYRCSDRRGRRKFSAVAEMFCQARATGG
jgi:hypothetical protein